MTDEVEKVLSVNGRTIGPYYGPIPAKGSVITLDDGRSLCVVDVFHRGRINLENSDSRGVFINAVVISARFM